MFLGGCALEAVSLLWRNEYKEAEEEEELTEEEKMIESTENLQYLQYVFATVANTHLRSKYLPVSICYHSKYLPRVANTYKWVFATVANTHLGSKYLPVSICYRSKYSPR